MDTRGDDYDSRDRLLHGQTSPPNNPMNKDFYLQFWRSPRLRKLLILGCVVLFLSLAFFLKELGGPERTVDELASGPPPSHIVAAPVTITTTFTAPAVTETVYVYQDVATAPNVDPVVFVLIMWSEASAAEGALLIKVSTLTFRYLPMFIRGIVYPSVQHKPLRIPHHLRRGSTEVPRDQIGPGDATRSQCSREVL